MRLLRATRPLPFAHDREARKATEKKNRVLITMYHEISMASTQFGIEIGKGMQATQHRSF